jgi:hypothetical protein
MPPVVFAGWLKTNGLAIEPKQMKLKVTKIMNTVCVCTREVCNLRMSPQFVFCKTFVCAVTACHHSESRTTSSCLCSYYLSPLLSPALPAVVCAVTACHHSEFRTTSRKNVNSISGDMNLLEGCETNCRITGAATEVRKNLRTKKCEDLVK